MISLAFAVKIGIIFSGIFLWVGMLTGVWKYYQIRHSQQSRAHYYVDIAHRSSLLYAPASLILAVLAYFSVWSDMLNVICVILNSLATWMMTLAMLALIVIEVGATFILLLGCIVQFI